MGLRYFYSSKKIPQTPDPGSLVSCGCRRLFPEAVTIFGHTFRRKSIRFWILSLQTASILSATSSCFWVKSSKLKLSMFELSEQYDWLMTQMSEADRCILSLGGKRPDIRGSIWGRLDEAFIVTFCGGRAFVTTIGSEADRMQHDYKSIFTHSLLCIPGEYRWDGTKYG